MKGLTVTLAPSRNIVVPTPSVIGGTEFGKGNGSATGVPIVQPPANPYPDAVTPNTTVKKPVTMNFGAGDLANGPDEDSPDEGHLLNTKK